eukprot:5847097-Amphidinium_carterae.3
MVSIGAIDGLVDLIANHGTHIKTALGALARFATVTSTVTHLISCGVPASALSIHSESMEDNEASRPELTTRRREGLCGGVVVSSMTRCAALDTEQVLPLLLALQSPGYDAVTQ